MHRARLLHSRGADQVLESDRVGRGHAGVPSFCEELQQKRVCHPRRRAGKCAAQEVHSAARAPRRRRHYPRASHLRLERCSAGALYLSRTFLVLLSML